MSVIPSGEPVFWLESTYDEREAAKAAGFLWHGGNCKANCGACAARLAKVWWTRRIEAARGLTALAADDEVRAVLRGDKPPAAYEPPVDIPDPNLHLALLSALIYEGVISVDLKRFARIRPDRSVLEEVSEDGRVGRDDWMYVYNEDLAASLRMIPITPSQLARLREVAWSERRLPRSDGGSTSLREMIWPQWDGESEEFEIRDFTGLAFCTGLEKLTIDTDARGRPLGVEGSTAKKQLREWLARLAKRTPKAGAAKATKARSRRPAKTPARASRARARGKSRS